MTNWPPLVFSLVVAMEVLTPNSYRARVLPLPLSSMLYNARRAADALHFRRMQRIEFVFVAGQLIEDCIGPLQNHLESRFKCAVARDLTPDIPDQATKPGAHLPDPTEALGVTSAVQQPGNLAPGPCRQTLEGLEQLDAVASGGPVQPFNRSQDQMAIDWMSDRFSLNRRIHRYPLELALADGLCLDRDLNRLRQQRLQSVRSDPLVPADHRRVVEGQMMLKVGAAAERLHIQVLEPDRAGLLVAQPLHLFEQMQPCHQVVRQTATAFSLVLIGSKRIIEPATVYQARQPD